MIYAKRELIDMELGFYLKQEHYEMMLEDVIKRAPIESCGMVAGRNGYSEKIYSITNILNSPIRYRMLPEEQLFAFNDIENCGLELIAIYHSHPKGPHRPSETDISEFYYAGTISLIWSPQKNDWVCHGFRIEGDQVSEVLVKILEKE